MTGEEFVDTIRTIVLDASVSDTVLLLRQPPGRRPPRDLVELSEWYNRLGADDRARIRRIIEITARQSVFGLLSVLDGSRQIEGPGDPKGHFELRYVKDGDVDMLAGVQGQVLHELLP